MHRLLATAAAVGAALSVVPSASAQGPDTTAPVLNAGTLTPTAAPQRNGNPPAAPSTSTGNNGWFTQSAPTVLNVTATDDVAVAKLQYSTDAGANWLDMTITPGPSVGGTASFTGDRNTAVRYRALDAAGNVSVGPAAATTLNQASAVGATAIRLQSTNGRAVGDTLVIDTGANAETVKIATIPAPAPASPNPNVTLTAPLTKAHPAATAVQAIPAFRTINVQIDTTPPTATFPASVVGNRIGHGAALISPTRVDPAPASGGTAVRDTWLDGTWTYPLPLDVSKLALGRHTWTLGLTDNAGNGNKVTLTFLVTTSFADIDALLARFGTARTIPAATVTSLRASLASAKAANDSGDTVAAVDGLDAFVSQVRSGVTDEKARNLLATDGQDVARQTRGIPDAPAPGDLGITSERYPGQPRHPYVSPAMPTHNANAKFKVLVIANWTPDFRHPAIEDATVMIQELGAQYGFDVDLWDQQWPTQSLPDTPFTSAADLAKYAVIIGNSSVAAGNGQFKTNFVMKDGRVVDEQAAFQGYIRNGGGFVALHGANDSMHQWPWYKDFLGGLFVQHPSNQSAFGTDCGSCYWAELITEDGSHPSTTAAGKPVKVAVADELYHFDRKPRGFIHPLMLLNEDTYATAMGVSAGAANLELGDHPIAWCSNYDGGREWSQVLGHNWELFRTTPWFRESVYQGILTAAGLKPANCVTHVEVKSLLGSLGASGGLTAGAVSAGTAAVDAAFTKYMTLTQSGYSASLGDIDTLRSIAQDPASGDAAARAKVLAKAQELKDWMGVLLGSTSVGGSAGGTVPATLALSLGGVGGPASFGGLTPGVGKTYTGATTATVISTAGDATLSVADPSTTATGRLVNGTFSLAAALQAMAASPLGAGGAPAAVGGSSAPTSLLTYSGPVTNDSVAITFSQAVGANEALRTGAYSKTLTFTLSTTTP